MGALGLWVTFLFGHRAHSHPRRARGGGALAFMPRIFYHAHLDCFDVPVMTMWVVVLYAYWRSLAGGFGWAIATGSPGASRSRPSTTRGSSPSWW
jgi:4-amino-4-deoxy-L-arabinose transferase-like glycosyltransferase